MAEYTNLTSLEGLQVGDKIIYDTDTVIYFKGSTVRVELYGRTDNSLVSNNPESGFGGFSSFIFETKGIKIPFFFSHDAGCSLCYGEQFNLYYRIAVAGDCGNPLNPGGTTSTRANGGNGGGLEAQKGGGYVNSERAGGGGNQTSGGTNIYNSQYSGEFGYGGVGSSNGGNGWYGGASGSLSVQAGNTGYGGSGGGGSGFIIGVSTTTYPDGYLGNDQELISQLEASISDGVLTQGGSSYTSPIMVLTIIEKPKSGLPFFNGHEYKPVELNFYNGTEFKKCDVLFYDGTQFRQIEGGTS